jgi:hypothetical protein|tara:strand:- start:257 stop:385 length:129 start_codon:yes stop_codon:yes gene_type:complete
MKNKRLATASQRKRQLARQHHKVATRRQEFFMQTLHEEKLID